MIPSSSRSWMYMPAELLSSNTNRFAFLSISRQVLIHSDQQPITSTLRNFELYCVPDHRITKEHFDNSCYSAIERTFTDRGTLATYRYSPLRRPRCLN